MSLAAWGAAAETIEGAKSAGADVTRIDLRDFPMPFMDEDTEAASGAPEHATRLKDLFDAHDGLLIACPEYNSSITAPGASRCPIAASA